MAKRQLAKMKESSSGWIRQQAQSGYRFENDSPGQAGLSWLKLLIPVVMSLFGLVAVAVPTLAEVGVPISVSGGYWD